MFNENKEPQGLRPIDQKADEVYTWWNASFAYVKKTRIATWKGTLVLAFVAGLAFATIWIAKSDLNVFTGAAEPVSLSLSTSVTSVAANEVIPVSINLNTGGNDVVVVNAIIRYDKTRVAVSAADVDLSGSIFATNNPCTFPADYSDASLAGKPCQIFNNNSTDGILSLVLAMPSHNATANPGVAINTTSNITVAKINFHALKDISSNPLNVMGIQYVASGNYNDSDVIVDDGAGTDILTSTPQRSTVSNGDLNADRVVNGADLSILRANFSSGEPNNVANVNGDNDVNGSDLSIVRSNFGKSY